MRFGCSAVKTTLAECEINRERIQKEIDWFENKVDFLVLPPLSITGYTCGQLFSFPFFIQRQWEAIKKLEVPPSMVVVTSVMTDDGERPYAFSTKGEVKEEDLHQMGVHICLKGEQASDSHWNLMPVAHKWTVCSKEQFAYLLRHKNVVFSSCGRGESTSRRVFSGIYGVISDGKSCLEQNGRMVFAGDTRDFVPIQKVNPFDNPQLPFVPSGDRYLQETMKIQMAALRRRLDHLGSDKVVVGVSGGLDSTLTLLLCYQTIEDKKNIVGITMPGFGTGERTKNNALQLMERMGIEVLSIPITGALKVHFKDIGQSEQDHNLAFENAQARERMQVLFDYANKTGALVVGTGDMSEAMQGFTTFGGDHLSMYNPNGGIPKTLVRALVAFAAKQNPGFGDLLMDIVDTPISPELLPTDQHTERILGEYLYLDFYIYHTIVNRYGREELEEAFRNAFHAEPKYLDSFYQRMVRSQFKRNCSPDSPQVLSVDASRRFLRLPSDMNNIF